MSQAFDLLESLTESMSGTADEGHIVIGRDRYITVPEYLKKIAVQFDHDIETVTFDCPKMWDDKDMSTMKAYVNYMRADGCVGTYLCPEIVADGDIIHFDWTISGNVTQVAGELSFLVCIKKVDAESGTEINHWNSELCRDMYISEGLKCQETILRRYPDIITQLLVRMSNAEAYVTPEAVKARIDECLENNKETQDIVKKVAKDYLDSDIPLEEVIHSTVGEYLEENPPTVPVDNTLSNAGEAADAKATGDEITHARAEATAARLIALGRNQAIAFETYSEMINFLNSAITNIDYLTRGQNIYIGTVNVPDLWIYSVEHSPVAYTYTDDAAFVTELETNTTVQIGYFKVAQLEGQKVDLTEIREWMQSFEDTKSDIVGSSLGEFHDLSTDDKWSDIVATIRSTKKLDGVYNVYGFDSDDERIPAINYTNITDVTEVTLPSGNPMGYIFEIKSPQDGLLFKDTPIYVWLYSNLTPENIKTGVKIGNPNKEGAYITGTFGSDATLDAASKLLSGVVAYGKNGTKYTGTNKGYDAGVASVVPTFYGNHIAMDYTSNSDSSLITTIPANSTGIICVSLASRTKKEMSFDYAIPNDYESYVTITPLSDEETIVYDSSELRLNTRVYMYKNRSASDVNLIFASSNTGTVKMFNNNVIKLY